MSPCAWQSATTAGDDGDGGDAGGAGAAAGADVSAPFMLHLQMEELVDKLRLLDYDAKFCPKFKLKPLAHLYFALPGAAAEQVPRWPPARRPRAPVLTRRRRRGSCTTARAW